MNITKECEKIVSAYHRGWNDAYNNRGNNKSKEKKANRKGYSNGHTDGQQSRKANLETIVKQQLNPSTAKLRFLYGK